MQVVYREKSGVGWWRRGLAAVSLLAGVVGAWCWLNWQAPLYEATLTILTTPERLAETEKIVAKCLRDPQFARAINIAAEQAVADERSLSFLHRHWQHTQTLPANQWEAFILDHLRRENLDDRHYRITLTYANFGKPAHAIILQEFARLLTAESERAVNIALDQQRADHAAALAQIDQEIQKFQPDKTWVSHRAQTEIILAMLAKTARGEPPTVAWQNAWRDFPELENYLADLAKTWDAWQNAVIVTEQRRAEIAKLADWIALPENQTVTQMVKRVVYHEDSPELIRLKDKKAEIEATRMRLLIRATPLHPLAQKMAAEIIELNAQINALTRLPHEIEDIETRTNPQLRVWHRELTDLHSALQAAEIVERAAETAKQAALAALKKADQETLADRDAQARQALNIRREQIASQKFSPPVAPFAIYAEPTIQSLDQKNYYLIYALGAFVGLALALLWLPGRRRTDFNYEDPPAPPPTYPVLGAIPDFRSLAQKMSINK